MIKNKICKVLVSAIVIIMMIAIIGQTAVFASKKVEDKELALSNTRWVKDSSGTYIEKGAYSLNTGSNYPIFQIVSKNGNTVNGTNYYCIKAKLGDTWGDQNNSIGKEVVYNTSYDFVADKTEIGNLPKAGYANTVSNNYGPILWILDNMYTEDGITTTQLLNNAGIVYGTNPLYPSITDWHYDSEELVWHYGYEGYKVNGNDVILQPEEIEAIQQAAIWHFTNSGDSEFDFTIEEGETNAGSQFIFNESNQTIKKMKQEQAAIVYNYFVNNAKTKTNYTGQVSGTLNLAYTTSEKIKTSGDNYIVGPMKVTTTGTVTNLNIQITPATGAKVTNANGTEKTFKANEEFYVTIPKANVTGNIQIDVTGKTVETQKKLWIYDGDKTEQPIIEVTKKTKNLSDQITATPNKQFDLALRKTIVKIVNSNGKTKSIINEDGKDATRNITVDTSSIPNTATYKHRKDPVVITTGDVVTYRISIYNEGEIDGYASKIVDQLPKGLVLDIWPWDGGMSITSNKGTTYEITAYDPTANKLELTAASSTAKKISKFNGTTLSSDYIDVVCKVTGTAKTDGVTKQYLTNIAYIAEGYDTESNKVVTEDRDGNESKTTTSPNKTANQLNNSDANNYKGNTSNKSVYSDTNNTEYYKGQEDDDDFEKVVILPKEFDLKLMKYIEGVNNLNQIGNDGYKPLRTLTVDATNLNKVVNGKKVTTADYQVSKVPVTVKTGDYVMYTFKIYNEGEVAGYASEISENIPEGLKFVTSSDENLTEADRSAIEWNDLCRWKLSSDGKTITTDYLSKENSMTILSVPADYSKEKYPYYKGETNLILPFDGEYMKDGPDSVSVSVLLKVTSTDTKNIIRNEAAITEDTDLDGNPIDDRDSDTEEWKKEDSDDNYENNPDYPKYKEDDEDYDNIKLAKFDLALRKFITKISEDGNFNAVREINPSRAPQVDSSKLKAGTADTATYNHSKEPIVLNAGDYILYTIRAYNEGDIDGYASEIIDYLPENLDFVESTDSFIKSINDKWTYDSKTRKVTTNSVERIGGVGQDKLLAANATTKLAAFDAQNDDGKGSGLSYVDVQIVCKVNKKTPSNKKLTNIAEISEYKDENGNEIEKDRDSVPGNIDYPDNPATYKDDEINKSYVPGQQDDDDFEKVIVKERKVDLALTKFIIAVSADTKIEDGEYLTPNKKIGSKTNEYTRATVADTTGLKNGTSTNATYTPKKDIEPLAVGKNSYILYNIRVYNEGEVDVFAGKVTDYLPANLEFVKGEFNDQYGWKPNGQTVETTYLSSTNGQDKILKAFDKENDDGKGSGLDYKDLPVLCKVSDKAESGKKMVNTAEITKYEDEDGNELTKDEDSTPENKEKKNVEERDEDDDDYEVVIIKDFDLALRKFITEIDTLKTQKDDKLIPETNFGREPKLSYENNKITYTHPKDVVRTTVDAIVTYTLRVYNEGDIAGFAEEITDDIPEHLEFLPEHATNREYKWVMYDKDGKSTTKVSDAVKIRTDYTSKSNGELLMKNDSKLTENPNLLKAFDKKAGITDKNPDYVDVKVAFKVKDPKSNKTVIVNKAQISEDADENGNPVDDIDSIPDKWNDGEDDQDYENVAVDYFDLSLLKYVTKTIVTENGKTKTTKTGNNGSSKDITPKVEVYRKSVNKVIVKFEYTIKITNEGDIAGYAREITDYVPKGLKFYKEDNKGWKDEGNNVISTKLLKDILLQPGQSATVKVILRWVNGENNLGVKTNIAEISEDYNEKGVPDRDSTPDNKKKGEDDIDDAPVLLTISTGILEHTIQYVVGALVILVVLGSGLVVIKKYVL